MLPPDLALVVRRLLAGHRTAREWVLEGELADPNAWMAPDVRPRWEPAVVVAGRTDDVRTRRDALELRDLIDELISAGAATPR